MVRVIQKKTALILGLILLTSVVFALEAGASHCKDPKVAPSKVAEQKPNFPIGSKLSRGLQKYTGINFLTELVAQKCTQILS